MARRACRSPPSSGTPPSCTRARAIPRNGTISSLPRTASASSAPSRHASASWATRTGPACGRSARAGPSTRALRRVAGGGAAGGRAPLSRQRRQRGTAARPRPARGLRGVGPGGAAGGDSPRRLRSPRRRASHPRRGAAAPPRRSPRQWLLIGWARSRPRRPACRSSSPAASSARWLSPRRTGGRSRGSGCCPRCSPPLVLPPRAAFRDAWLEGTVFFVLLLRWLDHTFRHYSAIPWPLTWLPILLLAAYCALYVGLAGALGRLGTGAPRARPRAGHGGAALGRGRVAARLAHGRVSVGPRRLLAARRAARHPDRRAHRRLRRLIPARGGELRARRAPRPGLGARAARARRRRRGASSPPSPSAGARSRRGGRRAARCGSR